MGKIGKNLEGTAKDAYSVSGTSPPPSKDQVANRIFYFVFAGFRPVTERQIQRAVRARKALVVVALRDLVRKKLLKRLGRGRRNEPHLYFVCPCSTCLRTFRKSKRTRVMS